MSSDEIQNVPARLTKTSIHTLIHDAGESRFSCDDRCEFSPFKRGRKEGPLVKLTKIFIATIRSGIGSDARSGPVALGYCHCLQRPSKCGPTGAKTLLLPNTKLTSGCRAKQPIILLQAICRRICELCVDEKEGTATSICSTESRSLCDLSL